MKSTFPVVVTLYGTSGCRRPDFLLKLRVLLFFLAANGDQLYYYSQLFCSKINEFFLDFLSEFGTPDYLRQKLKIVFIKFHQN